MHAFPVLTSVDVATQYRAVVEAAALCGVRVGSVQPLATAALDSDLFAEVPETTFWWAAEPDEVLYAPYVPDWRDPALRSSCGMHGDKAGPTLPFEYTARFVEPPHRSSIERVRHADGLYYVGQSLYRGRMRRVCVANAIPDVVPDAPMKYAWRDVALLNYSADLAPHPLRLHWRGYSGRPTKAELIMAGVIPRRVATYGESVFWFDMARCLPDKVIDSASIRTPHFARATTITEDVAAPSGTGSRRSLSVGEFLYTVAPRHHDMKSLRRDLLGFLERVIIRGQHSRYLAGAGTHDTVPASPRIAALVTVLAHALPGAVPLIFSGQERFLSDLSNAEFGSPCTERYEEAELSLFSRDTTRSFRGISADELLRSHFLPTFTDLLSRLNVWSTERRVADPHLVPRLVRASSPTGQLLPAWRLIYSCARTQSGWGAIFSLSERAWINVCCSLGHGSAWLPLSITDVHRRPLEHGAVLRMRGIDIVLWEGSLG